MFRTWDDLTTAERLVIIFDSCGCLGISELIHCLNQDDYGVMITFVRVSGISAEYGGVLGGGSFVYQRNETHPLQEFVGIAQGFEEFSIQEQQTINAVCLEIALALNGKGERILFESLEVSVGRSV